MKNTLNHFCSHAGNIRACRRSAWPKPSRSASRPKPYPPFASLDASGNWVGWEVEIIGAVCKEAKLECVVTPVAWDGIIPALTAKKIDAIMARCRSPKSA
jgi:polar amino acid transport system substrate-binding protein